MQTWKWLVLGLIIIASLVAEFNMEHHADHWWSAIPGFFILFGFIGCLLLIKVAKGIGKRLLLKSEDYYESR